MSTKWIVAMALVGLWALAVPGSGAAQEEEEPLGFFITSRGLGNGADLGGLAGADAHCQALAQAAGAGNRTWQAYLSTQASGGQPAVNASARIGQGPWHNAEGLRIAADARDLHFNNSALNYENALTETGERVNSGASGDSPNMHDILTGSQVTGAAFPPGEDRTCSNWTSSGEGSAMVGHHDRFTFQTLGSPWNQAHPSQGCSQEALVGTGGNGLFYCFASD